MAVVCFTARDGAVVKAKPLTSVTQNPKKKKKKKRVSVVPSSRVNRDGVCSRGDSSSCLRECNKDQTGLGVKRGVLSAMVSQAHNL